MTFLCRKKSGIWYYRKTFLLPSGKRKEIRQSLRTSDFKQAQFLALQRYFNTDSDQEVVGVITGQKTGEHVATITQPKSNRTPSLFLNEAITQFLAEKHRTGFWCAKEYRRGEVMLQALGEQLGAIAVSAVGRKDANQFKQSLLTTDRSITTVNNYLKRAATLFEWLLHSGECSENPFKGLQIKQRRVLSQLRDAFTVDDKAAFLQFAQAQEEWGKWILLLLRYTGARPSEICQLYKDDVDLQACTISIHATRPDQTLKTPSSARILPIHSKLLEAGFLNYVNSCTHLRLFPVLNNLEKGGYSHTFVTWFSKARTKASQLGKSLPELYGARHTAATEMKNAGIPNQFASAVLGHSNNSITYDRYGKGVDVHHLRRAVEAIGQTGRDGQ